VEPATTEPSTLIAGDSIAWRRVLPDFPPAAGWAVEYALRGPEVADVAATVDGDGYLVEITAATSAGWDPGRYVLAGFATLSGDRVTFYRGDLVVEPNPDTMAAGHDARSYARRMLEAIEATLAKRATRDQMGYTIDGRSLSRMPVADLLAFRDRFRREVAAEDAQQRIAQGIGNRRRTIRTRFGRGY
jgi:hypothetical protein